MPNINVTNFHTGPLSFAGVTAPKDGTVSVDKAKWDAFAGTRIGKNWTEKGVLKVEGPSPVAKKADENKAEDDAKDALISQLAELDVKADKRMSLETLQAKLDDATAPVGEGE